LLKVSAEDYEVYLARTLGVTVLWGIKSELLKEALFVI
jgi:hypothetical protein